MTKKVGLYEMGKVLGEGSFGTVREATHSKTKEKYAMKVIEKEKIKREDLIESLKKEISILMLVNHPNIVKLIEVLASKTKIYLVLEYIDGGELWNRIKDDGKIGEEKMRKYFRQIVRAILYCKGKNIAHRDIKPENILLDSNEQVKVSDFGLSSLYKDPTNLTHLLHTTCGTISYLAPEVIQNLGYDGHKADVWSLGVVLFFCIYGHLPFEDDNVTKLLEKIVSANYEIPKNGSRQLKELLKALLNPHPNKRCSIEFVTNHPWFLENISEEELLWLNSERIENDFSKKNIKPSINLNFESEIVDENGILSISPKLKKKFKPEKSIDMENPEIIKPKNMNCFELMNFLSGAFLNRIFDVEFDSNINLEGINKSKVNKNIEVCQQFTLNKNLKEIYEKILLSLQSNNPSEIVNIEPKLGFKLKAVFKSKKCNICIFCEVFKLTDKQYLINFSKGEGSLKEYLRIYRSIYEYLNANLL